MNALRDPNRNPLALGQTLGNGRYCLQTQLGESPLVWLAQDEMADQLVSLRFLSSDIQNDARAWEELRRQVELARDLQHPHIARVLDLVGESDAPAFFVQEHVEGTTLAAFQQEQSGEVLTWSWLEPRVIQLCEALRHAHERGSVHGAIQPENIVVNRMGDLKLVNHGVSVVLANPLYSGTTQQHQLVYLSPQVLGGQLSEPTDDIYALGVTLYRLLSGTTPFYGGELLSQIRSDTPAPLEARLSERQIVNPVPIAASRFILASLSKNPAVRPQDLRELSHPAAFIESQAAPFEEHGLGLTDSTTTEGLPPQGEDEFGEVRRMRAAIQRDARGRLAITISTAAIMLMAGVGAWLVLGSGKHSDGKTAQAGSTITASAQPAGKPSVGITAKAATGKSQAQPKPATPVSAAPSEQGFEPLFNGHDLSGWSGDSRFWSARDGAIVGMARSDAPPRKRAYLVWNKGPVENFELRFSFRCIVFQDNNQPNAGIAYRASTAVNGQMKGYQYDIARDPKDLGALLDDEGRKRLAGLGEMAVARAANGKDAAQITGSLTPDKVLADAFNKSDWNDSVIIARGNRLTHKLNGHIVADVTDEHPTKSHRRGLLALELYTRNANNPATLVQFRNLRLKKLDNNDSPALALTGQ